MQNTSVCVLGIWKKKPILKNVSNTNPLSNTKVHILMDHKFLVFTLTSFSNFLVWCTPQPLPKKYFSRKRNLIGKNTKLKTALRFWSFHTTSTEIHLTIRDDNMYTKNIDVTFMHASNQAEADLITI